jgi:hypothetical protein
VLIAGFLILIALKAALALDFAAPSWDHCGRKKQLHSKPKGRLYSGMFYGCVTYLAED